MFEYLQQIYTASENLRLRFQIISKADETHLLYFTVTSEQVVLVAITIFKLLLQRLRWPVFPGI